MNLKLLLFIVSALLVSLTTGCQDKESSSEAFDSASPTHSNSAQLTDKWLGKWTGPEGTFILLTGSQGKYEITVQNLDGPQTFHGLAAGDHIEFERNGVKEQLRAVNGAGTGMKWLSEKSNCLVVRTGEGYCRD